MKRKRTIFESYGIKNGKEYLIGLNSMRPLMKENEEPIKRQNSLYNFKNNLDLLGMKIHEKPKKKKEYNTLNFNLKPPLK
jgi:hypothetical protein